MIVGVFYIQAKSALPSTNMIVFPLWWLFIYFIVVTCLFVFLIKYVKNSGLFFRVIFIVVLFTGAQVFFSIFFNQIVSAILAFIFVCCRYYYPTIWLHDLAIIIGIGGLAGSWGVGFSVTSMIIILFVLSIYDYVAVYKTKHMVKMAQSMIKYQAIIAIIIPEHVRDYLINLNEFSPSKGGFMILGGGDLALPSLFLVSVLSQYTIYHSLIVLFFILLGLFVMHYAFISQKNRKAMPALPPLAIFSIIGFIVSLLIL